MSVKPSAIVIAEPGAPVSEASGRMLALQVATVQGPIVPILAMADADHDAAIPTALRRSRRTLRLLIGRLQSALRVRALHSTVLRRIETFAAAPRHHAGIARRRSTGRCDGIDRRTRSALSRSGRRHGRTGHDGRRA